MQRYMLIILCVMILTSRVLCEEGNLNFEFLDSKYDVDALVPTNSRKHPLNVFKKEELIFVVLEEGILTDNANLLKIHNQLIKIPMPDSETDLYAKYVSASDAYAMSQSIRDRTQDYPFLWLRVKNIPDQSMSFKDRSDPIHQMFSEWIGISRNREFKISQLNSDFSEFKIGRLTIPPYQSPPFRSVYGMEHDKQPEPAADLVKPVLFWIDGQYYTIYGDTQLAEHLPLPDNPEQLAAFRYAGNILWAFSRELPPALQSCGVDSGNNIWIADQDNHLAVFKTDSKAFIQQIIDFETSATLVPRHSASDSVFIQPGPEEAFTEFHVSVSDTLTSHPLNTPRILPADTNHILYCSDSQVAYVAGSQLHLKCSDSEKNASVEIKINKDEYVMEGVYEPDKRKAAFLIAKRVEEVPYMIGDLRKSWQHMRVVYLQLP